MPSIQTIRSLTSVQHRLLAWFAALAVIAASPSVVRADTEQGSGPYALKVHTCSEFGTFSDIAELVIQAGTKAQVIDLGRNDLDGYPYRRPGSWDTLRFSWPWTDSASAPDKLVALTLQMSWAWLSSAAWCIDAAELWYNGRQLWAYYATDPAPTRVGGGYYGPHLQSGKIWVHDIAPGRSSVVRFTDKYVTYAKSGKDSEIDLGMTTCTANQDAGRGGDAGDSDGPVWVRLEHDGLIDQFRLNYYCNTDEKDEREFGQTDSYKLNIRPTVDLTNLYCTGAGLSNRLTGTQYISSLTYSLGDSDSWCIASSNLKAKSKSTGGVWSTPWSTATIKKLDEVSPNVPSVTYNMITTAKPNGIGPFMPTTTVVANQTRGYPGLPLQASSRWDAETLKCALGTSPSLDACGRGDEDCDGVTDENFVSTLRTCGVGACYRDTWTYCNTTTNETVGTCTPGSGTTEICNGIDDNCDGKADAEAFAATAEICDNLDNNCNDIVDDVPWTPVTCGYGVCQGQGFRYCAAGAMVTECYEDYSRIELDNDQDGVDDDCDGVADDDTRCIAATCESLGAQCGVISDGCGGTLQCSNCEGRPGTTCGGDGRPYICAPSAALPDPATVAPPLAAGTPFLDSVRFLYEASPRYQINVAAGAIREDTAAAVRGHVFLAGRIPLPGIRVSVQDHPEYGETYTRNDGAFDMVINGGAAVALNFTDANYLPVQRSVAPSWGAYGTVRDVVMIGRSQAQPTTVVLNGTNAAKWASGDLITADDYDANPADGVPEAGPRQVAVMFPANTRIAATNGTSSIDLSGGATVQLREFTVGNDGAAAMPGELPPSSQYTYAFEASIAEAGPEANIQFLTASGSPREIPFYVENFLQLPTGSAVPLGAYDRGLTRWNPMPDGSVIKILSETASSPALANVDFDGDGDADATDHARFDSEERQMLAARYNPGSSLWRFKTSHFTPFDCNLLSGTLASKPDAPPRPAGLDTAPDQNSKACGSILHCESRMLGERIPLTGTGLDLTYHSGRVTANTRRSRTLELNLNPAYAPIPADGRGANIIISVAGREFDIVRSAAELNAQGGAFAFEWDGLDVMGRRVVGPVKATYTVAWITELKYLVGMLQSESAANFGGAASGCTLGTQCCSGQTSFAGGVVRLNGARFLNGLQVGATFTRAEVTLGSQQEEDLGLGGWRIGSYQRLDPLSKRVTLGDGSVRSVEKLKHRGSVASAAKELAYGLDGTLYFVENQGSTKHLKANDRGQVHLVDDQLGTMLAEPTAAADGRIYVVRSDGGGQRIIYRYSRLDSASACQALGKSQTPCWRKDVLRTALPIGGRVTATRDGTIFAWQSDAYGARILLKVRPSPAANGEYPVDVVWTVPTPHPTQIIDILALHDGRIWVISNRGQLHEVLQDGNGRVLNTECGGTTCGANPGDTLSNLNLSTSYNRMLLGSEGNVFIENWGGLPGNAILDPAVTFVRRITPARRVEVLKIDVPRQSSDTRTAVSQDGSVAILLTNLSTLTIAQDGNREAYEVVSEDGSEVYEFDKRGLHLRTRDAFTNVVQHAFGHDTKGRLASIENRVTGEKTLISRSANGLEVYFDAYAPGATQRFARSTMKLDARGYMAELLVPQSASEANTPTWKAQHDAQGLLRRIWTPRANASQYSEFGYESTPATVGADAPPPMMLLLSDRDPMGGFQTLKAGTANPAYVRPTWMPIVANWCDGTSYITGWRPQTGRPVIQRTTGLGRTTTYDTVRVSAGGQEIAGANPTPNDPTPADPARVIKTDPSGYWTVRDEPAADRTTYFKWPNNDANQTSRPAGGVIATTWKSDPRLGSKAPYAGTTKLEVNAVTGRAALSHTATMTRVYSGLDASDTRLFNTLTVTSEAVPLSGGPRRKTSQIYDRPLNQLTTASGSVPTRSASRTLDASGRTTRVQMPGQVATQLVYGDAAGNELASGPYLVRVTRTKGSEKREQRLRYNANGYLEQAQVMDGASAATTTTFAPDLSGFPRSSTTSGATTTVTPDVQYGITGVTPPGKAQHTSIIDIRGLTTRYSAPYPSSTQACPIGSECMSYTADRELRTITLGDGTVITNTHAPSTGLLTTTTVKPTSSAVTQTFNYTYELGRLKTAKLTGTAGTSTTITDTITYQSDLPIEVSTTGTWLVGSTNVPVASKVSYVYNDFLELKTVSAGPSAAATAAPIASATYDRDADGLLSSVTFGGTSPLTFNLSSYTGKARSSTLGTVKTRHDFDDTTPDTGVAETAVATPGFGDLTALNTTVNNVNVSSQSYTYDNLGRIKTQTTSVLGEPSVVYTYNYDSLGRLASVLRGGTPVSTYTYDANGNRTLANTTVPTIVPTLGGLFANAATQNSSNTCTDSGAGDRDELCLYGGYQHKFNMLGQMIGRTRGTFSSKFSYDAASHLTKVEIPGSPTVSYVNDVNGRRIAKLSTNGSVTTVVAQWAYMSDLRPVLQTRSDGSQAFFVYGNKANVPEAMLYRANSSAAWKTYRLITDHLGSVRLVVDAACASTNNTIALINANNCVAQRTDYDEYGNITKMVGDAGFQPFGFAGGLHDRDTGLVRFGARDYDPWTGRWTSRDPILFDGGDSNLYAYVNNDPVNLIDPAGTDALDVAADFAAGMGDALTGIPFTDYSLTGLVRDATDIGGTVNKCSGAYFGGQVTGTALATAIHARGYATGHEFKLGKMRIAPWGNRTGHPTGRYPHYHRPQPHPNPRRARTGESAPGQGINRHRPWDKSSYDRSFWDLF